MQVHYNVLKEPWIPAVDLSGEIHDYGILEVLEKAPELKEIRDASPLVEYGIYRLLCVFLMDALRPEDAETIEDLLYEGSFDMEQIEDYVARCEAEGASFDLFDEQRPFLQTKKWDNEEKSIGYLDKHVPAGHNHIHFNHLEEEPSLSFAEAARLLPTCFVFAGKGGAGYHKGINGIPPFYSLVKGDNLFQTLVYTLLPIEEINDFDSIPVFWNCKEPVIPKNGIGRVSWLYGMFFPARRVMLIPTDEKVKKIHYDTGMFLENTDNWIDPHVTYIMTTERRKSWCPDEKEPLWKNLSHLVSVEGKGMPLNVSNYIRYLADSSATANINLYGLQMKKDAVSYSDLIYRDLKLSICLFNTAGAHLLGECIKKADELGTVIQKAFTFKPSKNAKKPYGISKLMGKDAQAEVYHRSETALLKLCASDLSADRINGGEVLRSWQLTVYRIGKEVRDQTLAKVNLSGRQWLALYEKQEALNRYLMKLKKEGEAKDD